MTGTGESTSASFRRPRGAGRCAFAKVELLAIILVLLLLATLITFAYPRVRTRSIVDVESGQLRGIHQSWLIFARDFDGTFPIPGAMKRKPVERDGRRVIVPGRGEIDVTQNTTANLYSATIMQNYSTPELCVGPAEPSPHVRVMGPVNPYDWDAYSPVDGIYWDDDFKADLHEESNVSYAHVPLFGARVGRHWGESLDETNAVLSHRGPENGEDPASITLKVFPPFGEWRGIVVNGDNSAGLETDMFRGEVKVETPDGLVRDHYFRFDQGPDGTDAILTFTEKMTEEGPVVQWD